MSDPRKPVHTVREEEADRVRAVVYDHLRRVTSDGAKALGTTGASFVMMGIGIWLGELSQLDQRATSKLLSALSVIHSPTASKGQKRAAEIKRAAAVRKLFSALDLDMSQPQGRS